jgi:hypothetical protein
MRGCRVAGIEIVIETYSQISEQLRPQVANADATKYLPFLSNLIDAKLVLFNNYMIERNIAEIVEHNISLLVNEGTRVFVSHPSSFCTLPMGQMKKVIEWRVCDYPDFVEWADRCVVDLWQKVGKTIRCCSVPVQEERYYLQQFLSKDGAINRDKWPPQFPRSGKDRGAIILGLKSFIKKIKVSEHDPCESTAMNKL